MIDFLILPISLSFIEFVWLRTNAFVDFFGFLFKRFNIFYIKDYLDSPLFPAVEYSLWLYIKHKSFITKLLSCPLCCSFWINLIFVLWSGHWSNNFPMLLFNVFWTLIFFLFLDKVYKHK